MEKNGMPARILVVDDEPLKRITLKIELGEHGYDVYEAADGEAARHIIDARPLDLVVSDVRMPGIGGLELLTYVKQVQPQVAVILMTAYATIDAAVLAMKRGACDYITKPFTTPDLLVKLEQLLATRGAPTSGEEIARLGGIAARSPAMKALLAQARQVAQSDRTVLLCGEGGTGKRLLAQAIHQCSPRRERPLIEADCDAIPMESLGAELFGTAVEGGAGQGPGRFALAEGGTLLLHAIENVPVELQPALLAAAAPHGADGGAGSERTVKARVICTTKCDLSIMVQAGRFSEELHYRLAAGALAIPPLRERLEDVPVLVQHFVQRQAARLSGRPVRVAPATLEELRRYTWPGNVRELEQVMERALAFCGGDEVRPEHVLPLGTRATEVAAVPLLELGAGGQNLSETMSEIERRLILSALHETRNNQARAAQRLGIPRTTLRDKMAKHAITGS